MNKKLQELKKLHKLIIHRDEKVTDDKEWYTLARRETKQIEKLPLHSKELNSICKRCFGR